jgi:hypothetical protein
MRSLQQSAISKQAYMFVTGKGGGPQVESLLPEMGYTPNQAFSMRICCSKAWRLLPRA